jgi:hypothetical protein
MRALRTNAGHGSRRAPIIVDLRCGEPYKGRTCGARVGDVTPGEVWRKSHPADTGRDMRFVALDWSVLFLEVNTPNRIHKPTEWTDGWTPAEMKAGTPIPLASRRIPDGEFELFTVESARMGPGLWMPAYIQCVCGRGRHRHLVVERDELFAAVSEWKTTKRKVTMGVTSRR